jgi:hypothetical protein
MINNQWLKNYGERVEKINYTIQECIMSGSADGKLDLEEVMELFRGQVGEIKNLQSQVDSLKEALIKGNKDG